MLSRNKFLGTTIRQINRSRATYWNIHFHGEVVSILFPAHFQQSVRSILRSLHPSDTFYHLRTDVYVLVTRSIFVRSDTSQCLDEPRTDSVVAIMQLAALIAIPFSYHSPDTYVDTNIKGTLNVLQAARDLDTRRVLVTSTSEVYGTAQYVPIDEKHPFQGQSPYSATKIGADRIAESFYRSFNTPVTIVRPFNTFGPRQSARAVIPTIISQLLAGKEEIHLGSLTPTRDFNYVKDTANGFVTIAKHDNTIGRELNIATEKEISIGQLAEELIRQINPNAKIVTDTDRLRPEKSEVNRLLGTAKELNKLTGWKPNYTFEEGIAETIEWFRHNLSSYKTDIYNI